MVCVALSKANMCSILAPNFRAYLNVGSQNIITLVAKKKRQMTPSGPSLPSFPPNHLNSLISMFYCLLHRKAIPYHIFMQVSMKA